MMNTSVLKRIAKVAATLLVVFVFWEFLVFLNWIASPSKTVTATVAPLQTVQRSAVAANTCDNIYREYHVTAQARPLLKQAGCTMGWNIQSGGLYLIDASGKVSGPFYKDSVVGVTSPAVEWRATEGGAIVKARFYN